MASELDDLSAFAAVVRAGGFRDAARGGSQAKLRSMFAFDADTPAICSEYASKQFATIWDAWTQFAIVAERVGTFFT